MLHLLKITLKTTSGKSITFNVLKLTQYFMNLQVKVDYQYFANLGEFFMN